MRNYDDVDVESGLSGGSEKRPSPQTIVPVVGLFFQRASKRRSKRAKDGGLPSPEHLELADQVGEVLDRINKRAFKAAGLDIDNEDHWPLLIATLAAAIYSPNDAGAPKKWDDDELRRLFHHVENAKVASSAARSESDCCKLLVKTGVYHGRPETLRRQLQKAKRLLSGN